MITEIVTGEPVPVSVRVRRAVDVTGLLALAGLLLVFFTPSLLLKDTTTTGGDLGAHVYTPWYLKHHLLPQGAITGWSPDWFAGFPILTFYFPLVVLFQAVASFVIPYSVAFKLGTALGTFFLPAAAYILMRLLRFTFPTPIVGATLATSFLFMGSFQIRGGDIASTMAGEYGFSLSLGLCLVVYGLLYRVATDDDPSPLPACLVLAAAALSHAVPALVVGLTAPAFAVWAFRAGGRHRVARVGMVFGLAFALTAFWSIPFVVRLPYTANMHQVHLQGLEPVLEWDAWIFSILGLTGWLLALLRKDPRVGVLVAPALVGLLVYFFIPSGRIWNGRFLPFWYVGLFLSAAYAIGTLVPAIARALRREYATVIAVTLTGLVVLASAGWILREKGPGYIDDWVTYAYSGYEEKPGYETFRALLDSLDALPAGRVMWETSPKVAEFGTPLALMSLPFWIDQASMAGLYYESSITSPFQFMIASEVGADSAKQIPGLPYRDFDFDVGVEHMQLFGVDYFVSASKRAERAARTHPAADLVDEVGSFAIFTIRSPGHVVVPRYEPVVLEDGDWTTANIDWFGEASQLDVPLVAAGPAEWERVSSSDTLPRDPVDAAGDVISVEMGNDQITFETEAVGAPHWVKTSYFPNWNVTGATGPFPASPSLMMVVPNQRHVTLRYGRTWAEWAGLAVSLLAALALVVPSSRRALRRVGTR